MVLVHLLEHLVAAIAVLDHAEGLRVLAPLIGRGLGHRLGALAISLALATLRRSHLILRHQRVELLRNDRSVV